jgi:MFS transporter, FSR family, fosmidomycin resistance protein
MTRHFSGRLATLTASHVVDDIYQGAVPALLPFLVAERQYSYAAVTGLMFAATFLSSLTQPLFGIWVDRRQITWLIPGGLFVAGLGVALSGVARGYPATWLVLAVSGLGVAAYHPGASRAVRLVVGRSATGMSLFALGGIIGLALGPAIVTPILLARGLSGTPLLVIPAGIMAVVLVLTRSAWGAAAEAGTAGPVAARRPDDWRSFRRLTGLVITRSILYFGIGSLTALYLIHQLGVSTAAAGAVLTVYFATGAIGTFLGGALADRIGRLRTVRIGFALMTPAILALVGAPNLALATAAIVVLSVAVHIPFSVHTTLGQEYLPNRIGTAAGVTSGLAVSAGGVLTPALGTLADHWGLRPTVAMLAALPVVAIVLARRLRDPGSASPEPAPESATAPIAAGVVPTAGRGNT